MDRLRAVLARRREFIVVLGSFGLNGVGNLVANRFMTQKIGPAPLGEFYLLTNVLVWITLPAASAYVFSLRHWPVAKQEGQLRAFVRLLQRLLLLQAVVSAVGVAAFGVWSPLGNSPSVLLALWIACVAQAVAQVSETAQFADRRRVTGALLLFLNQPIRLVVLGCAAYLFKEVRGPQLLWMQAIYTAGVATLGHGLMLSLANRTTAPETKATEVAPWDMRRLVKFAFPFAANGVVGQICRSAERWGLYRLADASATAIFTQGLGLSTAVGGAPEAIVGNYWGPILGQQASGSPNPLEATRETRRKQFLVLGSALILLAAGSILFSARVTPLLFGSRYGPVARLLPWTVVGVCFFSLGNLFNNYAYVLVEPWSQNVSAVVSQLAYVVCLVALPNRADPALGFARAYTASNALYAGMVGVFAIAIVRRYRTRLASREASLGATAKVEGVPIVVEPD